jgi:hypothetical protein
MMNFNEVVRDFLKTAFLTIEDRICPDQYVGIISTLHKSNDDFPERYNPDLRPNENPALILILESPHIDEFNGEPGPAKGTTGRLIRSHIGEMKCFREYSDYGLILMNAIQFQCSLGYPTDCFRDSLFRKVWRDGGKDQFIERLGMYLRSGDIIANCCTKGNGPKNETELRVLVQSAIKEWSHNLEPMRRTHPSSWYSTINRAAEWKFPVKGVLTKGRKVS